MLAGWALMDAVGEIGLVVLRFVVTASAAEMAKWSYRAAQQEVVACLSGLTMNLIDTI